MIEKETTLKELLSEVSKSTIYTGKRRLLDLSNFAKENSEVSRCALIQN